MGYGFIKRYIIRSRRGGFKEMVDRSARPRAPTVHKIRQEHFQRRCVKIKKDNQEPRVVMPSLVTKSFRGYPLRFIALGHQGGLRNGITPIRVDSYGENMKALWLKRAACIVIAVGGVGLLVLGLNRWGVRTNKSNVEARGHSMTVSGNERQPLLANDYVTVYESPDPRRVFCYSPGLVRLDGGRLVATLDLREVKHFPGPKFHRRGGYGRWWQGKVFTSDDAGATWTHRVDFPFMHARPFVAGESLYVLGQADDLTIIRSRDGGVTWSEPARLSQGQRWGQAPSNVHYDNGCVYLTMATGGCIVLMRAKVDDDLTRPESWTFASRLDTTALLDEMNLEGFGFPFRGKAVAISGESHVVQFVNPDHVWFDPTRRTFHIWAKVKHGGTGYAAVLKVVEQGDEPGTGPMETLLEKTPSGKTMLFVPMPGGQMKFHVLYDDQSERYWLLSTQATDSMIRADRLPAGRYNAPNDQRRRLQLHFSKNMVDWCFAGLVAVGPVEKASRHYASMVFDGDDLLVLSRSGDERAKSAHDGNLITFHRVKDFRDLVY